MLAAEPAAHLRTNADCTGAPRKDSPFLSQTAKTIPTQRHGPRKGPHARFRLHSCISEGPKVEGGLAVCFSLPFQILTGEDWNEVMYDGIKSQGVNICLL